MEVNITDGSISRAEPSTLDTEIVEGSITKSRTIHAKRPLSRTVRWYEYEPSTLEARITEGSISRAEPSTLNTEIVEGSITKSRTIHDNAPYRGWSMMSR